MSGNDLEIVLEMTCDKCGKEVRENGRNSWGDRAFAHVGEPCGMTEAIAAARDNGEYVDRAYRTRRCKACWVPGTDTGRIETRMEAWGNRTVCLGSGNGDGCHRESYYSIGD